MQPIDWNLRSTLIEAAFQRTVSQFPTVEPWHVRKLATTSHDETRLGGLMIREPVLGAAPMSDKARFLRVQRDLQPLYGRRRGQA